MTTILVALPQPPCLHPYTVIRSGVRSQESDGEHPESSLGSGRRKRRTQVPGLRPRPKPCRLVWQKFGVPGGRGCFGVQTKLVIKRVRYGGVTQLHLLYMYFHVSRSWKAQAVRDVDIGWISTDCSRGRMALSSTRLLGQNVSDRIENVPAICTRRQGNPGRIKTDNICSGQAFVHGLAARWHHWPRTVIHNICCEPT